MPQLLSIVINILGEVEHYGQPYIIGSNLHISVPIVGLVEGREEAIVIL